MFQNVPCRQCSEVSNRQCRSFPKQSEAADFGEKVIKHTESQLVGMAVGSIARATLGRVPIAGPVLASAEGEAIMQEVSNQNVIDKGREVLNKNSDVHDDIRNDAINDEKMEDE